MTNKIEYDFDEPDYIMGIDPDIPFSKQVPVIKEETTAITFRQFLNSSKVLLDWHNKPVMATKKLKTKCYFLTKDWMVYEVRFKQQQEKEEVSN